MIFLTNKVGIVLLDHLLPHWSVLKVQRDAICEDGVKIAKCYINKVPSNWGLLDKDGIFMEGDSSR